MADADMREPAAQRVSTAGGVSSKAPKKQTASRAPARGAAPERQSADEIRAVLDRFEADFNAPMHVRAYNLDGNPRHLIDAYREYRKHKIDAPDHVKAYLDRALDEIETKPAGKPKQNTVRDLLILREVLLACPSDDIPAKLAGRLLARLVKQFKLPASTIKAVISRFREFDADPERHAPRAFRK